MRILLLKTSGNTKANPGPKKQSCLNPFYRNLNGLEDHDFIKLPLIESYILTKNFDIMRLCETSLDSSIPNDDSRINKQIMMMIMMMMMMMMMTIKLQD